MSVVHSACRICSGYCGLNFEVEDGQIVSATPDKNDPVSRGHVCIKGVEHIDLLARPNGRLRSSLRRKESGYFEPITKQEVVDEVAVRLQNIIDQHGPRSVAIYFGTSAFNNALGNIFSKAWLSAVGSPNLFTTMTLDQVVKWVTLARLGMHLGGEPLPSELDVSLVSGNNPLVSHYGFPATPIFSTDPAKRLKELKARGTKLIVVDPRRSETARAADIHLQILPGEDASLYAGMLNFILANDWIDHEFTKRHAINVERLAANVADYNLDFTADRVGVSKEKIASAAEIFVKAERAHAGSGTGTCMAPNSNLAEFLLESLNVVCGAFRKAGDRVPNVNPILGWPPVDSVIGPNRTWEHGPKCRTEDIGQIQGEFRMALLPFEILEPGKDKIRALVTFAGNPIMAMPDPELTKRALSDLDLLVTMDNRMTETAECSDYVVATSMQYERDDHSTLVEITMDHGRAQHYRPVVRPPEEVIHDWEFFWTLASRMGLQLEFKLVGWGGGLYHELPPGLPLSKVEKPNPRRLIEWICEQKGLSFEEITSKKYGQKIEPSKVVVGKVDDNGARLDLCPDDVAEELETVFKAEAPDAYRYRLAGRRLLANINSHYRTGEHVSKARSRNYALMHQEDMDADGIKDGDKIEIISSFSSAVGIVKEDKSVRRGVVSMAHCWGVASPERDPEIERGTHTGRLVPLTKEFREDISYMPHLTGIPVNVQLFRGAGAAGGEGR